MLPRQKKPSSGKRKIENLLIVLSFFIVTFWICSLVSEIFQNFEKSLLQLRNPIYSTPNLLFPGHNISPRDSPMLAKYFLKVHKELDNYWANLMTVESENVQTNDPWEGLDLLGSIHSTFQGWSGQKIGPNIKPCKGQVDFCLFNWLLVTCLVLGFLIFLNFFSSRQCSARIKMDRNTMDLDYW